MLKPEERRANELVDRLITSIQDLGEKQSQIHGDLRALLDLEQQKYTEAQERVSKRRARETQLPFTIGTGQPHEHSWKGVSHRHEGRGFKIANFTVQVVLCLVTSGAMGAAIWYASIAKQQQIMMERQLGTMDRTLKETQRQAGAAEEANTLTHNMISGTESAVFRMNGNAFNSRVNVFFTNIGPQLGASPDT